jgi:pseudouridine-5'-monophosphatase
LEANDVYLAELQAAEHLLSFFPNISLTLPSYLAQRNTLQDAIWPTVPLLPGVRKLVQHLKEHNIPIAVATGSRRRNFELKTGHLGEVFGCFEDKVICGDDVQYGMRGKPAPDIFLVAAKEMLGRDVGNPEGTPNDGQKAHRAKGLVFEDGVPGLQAGKRAGMSGAFFDFLKIYSMCLSYPHAQLSGSLTPISLSLAMRERNRRIRRSNP